ncbi:hypothetical protein ELE36_16225 [Pseudolysobacter antarcticus]|uniref:Delta-60 repeat domain-containing protein n=1 Tax=Pseudolysobacter antarcticus TaxID=2511995 RepID=A0A411HMS7_9GAMM|nr:hypothetical protein [Pseudolysobacter antarcticus]QBB71776.1 hypothetical protein ELE36_16225 [Pseudolysobacter antarcticus]
MTRHSIRSFSPRKSADTASPATSGQRAQSVGLRCSRFLFVLCALLITTASIHAQIYRADVDFNGGNYFVDAFSGSATDTYRGKKLVHLDNGDVVVAGLVPNMRGGNAGGLGLVRYNAAGQRVTWANPGATGFDGNQYVVYDANTLVPRPIDDVKDIVVSGNLLFVLVDVQGYGLHFSGNPPMPVPAFTRYASDVMVFNTDGKFLSSVEMGSTLADEGDPRNFFGGGIAVYQNSLLLSDGGVSLVFAGSAIESNVSRPVFQRFSLDATDGSLTSVTGIVYPNPGNYCPTNRGCEINGLALGGRLTVTGPPRIYLGGSRQATLGDNADWDFMVMRVSSNGAPDTSFNTAGVNVMPFNIAPGNLGDHGRSIAVLGSNGTTTNERIFVGGDVAVNCGDGMGVVKFNGDGTPDSTFGSGGLAKRYFGSEYSSSGCMVPRTDNYTHSITLAEGLIAFAGQRNTAPFFISPDSVDGVVAFMDMQSGSLISFDIYPYAETAGGSRSRHSGLWGIVAAGHGAFTATGDVRYFTSSGSSVSGKMQYATLRFSDRIFRSTLGHGDDPVTP